MPTGTNKYSHNPKNEEAPSHVSMDEGGQTSKLKSSANCLQEAKNASKYDFGDSVGKVYFAWPT